jgi:multiple sugar transport system permease protein
LTAIDDALEEPRGRLRRWHDLPHDVYLGVAGVTFVAPAVFFLCLVVVGPFVYVIWQSFGGHLGAPSGLANYRWFFGSEFWSTLSHGLIITAGSVAIEVVIALPLVFLLNERLPARGLLRGLVTLPWAVPTIAVSTAFLWLTDPFYGLFNQLGTTTGVLKQPIAVTGDPRFAIWAITAATAWKGLPLVFIILFASYQSLQSQYLEAAKVDGAHRWAQLRFVVLPHMRSAIALAAVLSGVYNFALLDLVYLLTGGGPAGLTTTWPLLLYNQQFTTFDTGRAAAVGVAIFIAGVIALAVVLGFERHHQRRYNP